MGDQTVGQLFFRCPTSGDEFDTGFKIDTKDLSRVPSGATMRLRCMGCQEMHEFKIAQGRIVEKPS
jgi:hypothetical protein